MNFLSEISNKLEVEKKKVEVAEKQMLSYIKEFNSVEGINVSTLNISKTNGNTNMSFDIGIYETKNNNDGKTNNYSICNIGYSSKNDTIYFKPSYEAKGECDDINFFRDNAQEIFKCLEKEVELVFVPLYKYINMNNKLQISDDLLKKLASNLSYAELFKANLILIDTPQISQEDFIKELLEDISK